MGSTVNTMSEHDMHLLDSAPFGRILPAMVTPMKSDGSVDFAAAQKLAKYLVADGADGLVVNGTTGESPVTHMDEKVELVRAVKEVVDVPVISGAGSNDTAHTVRMVEQTQEAGADAVLVVMPYYSRPSQDGIVGHYKAVDESAEKPIIVYDVPGRTGLKVKVGTYDRLAELEHVKAVKDATGDLAAAVEKQQRTGLAWYSGDDGLFLPFLSIGAVGIISVIAHVASTPCSSLSRHSIAAISLPPVASPTSSPPCPRVEWRRLSGRHGQGCAQGQGRYPLHHHASAEHRSRRHSA